MSINKIDEAEIIIIIIILFTILFINIYTITNTEMYNKNNN